MSDLQALADFDAALGLWEHGDLRERVEALASSAHMGHGAAEGARDLHSTVADVRHAIANARGAVETRFAGTRRLLEALEHEVAEAIHTLDEASEGTAVSFRDLHECVDRIGDDIEPRSAGVIQHLSHDLPDASNTTRDDVHGQTQVFGQRVVDDWLAALHDTVRRLDEHLASVETHLGTQATEAQHAVRESAESAGREAEGGAHDRLRRTASAAQGVSTSITTAGEAANATGTLLATGRAGVHEAGSAATMGVRLALEVLDELLQLFGHVTRDHR